MNVFSIRSSSALVVFMLALFVGAGIAQAGTIKCGGGILFFRKFDADDGAGNIKREIHFTIYKFTNPSSSATATISKIQFFDETGALVKTLGNGGDAFPADFDPAIGPLAQEDLDIRDVFETPDPPDKIKVRMITTSDKKLKASRARLARGFKPGFGQQEERTRISKGCESAEGF